MINASELQTAYEVKVVISNLCNKVSSIVYDDDEELNVAIARLARLTELREVLIRMIALGEKST